MAIVGRNVRPAKTKVRPQASGRIQMITNKKGFQVVCTNPANVSIESCWFDQSEWTVIDAVEQFCSDYEIELSECRVEPMDDSGEVVVSEIVEGVEVHRVFGAAN